MRPVRLDMNGFASFRTETTVDFEGADYFALTGPTGAGKSTVIDAMVFALYGSAPRWGRTNAVQYALAPTTTRATVRLLFDVGAERYRVAREVRRVGKTIQQKMATLERLDDPTSTSATTDEVAVIASEVRDVTPAVEALLGLSFEDFTKAVVLPQGRFAEFLSATVAERQDILLKLLGAHQYDIVMRAAGARRSDAAAELVAVEARIGDLGGATQEAADEAAARVEALAALGEQTASLQGSLDGARSAEREAVSALARAETDVARLAAVEIPDGLAELAARSTAVRADAERLRRVAAEAETAYGKARSALEAGGTRRPLELLRDQWAELAAFTLARPGLEQAVGDAETVTVATAAARLASEADWSAAFKAQADAGRAVESAVALVESLTGRRRAIAEVAAPVGLADLAQRLDAAGAAVTATGATLAEAESAEDAARQALREAGDAVELAAEVARCDEALRLGAKREEAVRRSADSGAALADAHLLVEQAETDLGGLRAVAAEARALVTAASLRAGLEIGHECPVCAAPVVALPTPIDASSSDAAEEAVRRGELVVRSSRDALTRAEAEVSAWARALAEAKGQLAAIVPDGADVGVLRGSALARRAAVAEAARVVEAAESARSAARADHEDAKTRSAQLDAERRDAQVALRDARAAVLLFGAPVSESGSLTEAWQELTAWVHGALADLDALELPQAVAAHERASAAASEADKALATAESSRAAAVTADEEARSRLLGARSALAGAVERGEVLRQLLDGAAPSEEVAVALDALTRLETLEKESLVAFQAAGRERNRAEAAEQELRAELMAADALLRQTRDPLVSLGAPAVDGSDLPAAWATLAAWASETRGSAEASRVAAETARASAAHAVGLAEQELVDAAVAGGVEVASAAGVASAVAAATARASDRVEKIGKDLERLAGLRAERAEAEERKQVAGLLADHLSAKKFQRWLAGAALDVLVEAASESLLELSGGQFTLAHDKGEFHVIDHADAEATRSVRTLSGGETFQASLALALALSAELSKMSSNAARLDSIFLDEGFGSLDPDSLEVVALTLERLAQGDRLVGVVTHVQGLAERIPTRFTVSRTSRSSTVTREG